LNRASRIAPVLFAAATILAAETTTPAEVAKYQEAVYPEDLLKAQQQGNVLLIGRIDREGNVQNLRMISASQPAFVSSPRRGTESRSRSRRTSASASASRATGAA
jgi:Gram-negative bacterial TonB protein C-terminal